MIKCLYIARVPSLSFGTKSDMHGVAKSSVPSAKKRSRTNKLTVVEEEIEDNEGDYVTIKKSEWEIANEGL